MLSGKILKNNILHLTISVLFIIFISFYSIKPILKNIGSSFAEANEDIMISWIINSHIKKIPHDIKNIFQGNIFYPYKNTLVYSEFFFASSLIAYLPVTIFKLPILAYNINLIFGQIFTITVIYLWFREVTKDNYSSLLASLALGVSQLRFEYIGHLQMWNMYWWILASWMLWRFIKKQKVKYIYLSSIFIVVQIWESILPIYFFAFFSLIMFIFNRKIFIKNTKHFIFSFLIIVLLTFPLLFAYYSVSREFHYVRSIRDSANFGLSLNGIKYYFSPGLFSIFLTSLLIFKKNIFKKSKEIKILVSYLSLCLITSLGPVLKWNEKTVKILSKIFIPLPYGVFYYLIPGFSALRTPTRWLWPFSLAMSGIIAIAFSNFKSRIRTIILSGAFLMIILGGTGLKKAFVAPIPQNYPEVYRWLKNQKGEVILEMPIYNWAAGESYKNEFWRMLYSLEHGKKSVNGASGFNPPEWEKFTGELYYFPNQELESKIKDIGVNYLIVHKKEYDILKITKILKWGKDKLIWEDKDTLVYLIN